MSDGPLKLIVLTGSDRPEVLEAWDELLPLMQETEGVQVVGTYARRDEIPEDPGADIVVVIGGDGSILRGCRQLGTSQLPIVGINLGRLGFLADITVSDFCGNLRQLRDGEYEVSEHLMFRCEHHTEGQVHSDLGLNEVTVTAAGSLKMLDIDLEIDGEPITTFSCDGLIVSTPVGSTAHNLSAGGPIMRQDLQAFCITPICPHTLTIRPIVDSAERTYELTVANPPEGVTLVIDGQISRPIGEGDRIVVKRAAATFKLVRFSGHSYYNTLHRKLGWRGQLDYRDRSGR
ncbi:MAG: NAD(+)/NADH kinase [Planctomycetaceae bacterium]|nr:NAD(+)/NADH kinase [Planctomycetaceae bacterium]